MPEVFNFTARATAASGAFADRDFSITVNNTQINRLLAVGQSGAARSINSLTPWVLIPGVKGDSAAYGDRWLIWDQTAGVMWTSPDAINFTSFVPGLPSGYTSLGFLRWRAGAWWGVGSTGSALAVLTSTDGGLTWVVAGATLAASTAFSFERSEGGASIIATITDWYFRTSDTDAWSLVKTFASSGYRFQIAHLNGIWFGPNDTLPNGLLARSTDGQGWFAQSNPTVLTGGGYYRGMAWGNGHAVAHVYYEPQAVASTDAGLTVQAAAALPSGSVLYDTECPIVCVQGRFVMLGDTGRTFAASTPAGPWNASNLPAGLNPSTLAVRP
ncbi:hypothetical protein GCM10011497_06400 [Elstera cyanobacteriorum]|uniref:Exo-alpha-sialidase n=1 Tax=Elstera cyanobacteriorum TaxID=2022747 RepID=A0A255XWH8_9PROT|nr:hypothetical protein [Elstera cyanobacteriorum]OYQ21328.1 hypothetical protein CHR90_02275 [Elstera cyanobacteriorum]GFZ80653.1 hypothetical protein GCM10011497_06400 [Elstera cyanobacteriorum]